jgi:hypothetical protein
LANVATGILLASGIQGRIDWNTTLLVLAVATLLHLGDVRSPRTGTDDASLVSGRGLVLVTVGASIAWLIRPECGVVAAIFGGIAAIHVAAFSMVARDEVTEASRWKCPRCGYPIAEGSDICTECGAACDAESIVAIATERLKKRRGWYGTATMVLVTPFGFFAILAAMIGMPTTGKRSEEWFLGAILISFVGIGAYLVNSTRHLAGHPNAVGRFVLRSIAVLTLFDAGVMAFFWVTSPDAEARFVAGLGVFAAIGCFFLVRWSHRRIAGT